MRGAEAPRTPAYCVMIVVTCAAVSLMSNADVLPVLLSRRWQFKVTVIEVGKVFAIVKGSAVAPGMLPLTADTTVTVVLSESTMADAVSCATRLHFT